MWSDRMEGRKRGGGRESVNVSSDRCSKTTLNEGGGGGGGVGATYHGAWRHARKTCGRTGARMSPGFFESFAVTQTVRKDSAEQEGNGHTIAPMFVLVGLLNYVL